MAISVELLVNSIAWQAASSPTLRLRSTTGVLVIYTVSGLTSPFDCRRHHDGERRQERNPREVRAPYARRALLHARTLRDCRARKLRRRLDTGREGRASYRDAGHDRARPLDHLA